MDDDFNDHLYKIQDPNSAYYSFLPLFLAVGILFLLLCLFFAAKYWGRPNGKFLQRLLWVGYDVGLRCVNSIIQWTPEWAMSLLGFLFPGSGEYNSRRDRATPKEVKAAWARLMRKHHEDPRKKVLLPTPETNSSDRLE